MLDGGPEMRRCFNRTSAGPVLRSKGCEEAHSASHLVGCDTRQSEGKLVNEDSLGRNNALEVFDVSKVIRHSEAPVVVRTSTVAEAARATSAGGGGAAA